MKVVLSTLPHEGEYRDWCTPEFYLSDTARYMPLGILSLASNLGDGHDVCVLDPSSEGWDIMRQ